MKTILAFGYIPKEKGGKQTTGLGTGIFDLHDSVNALHSDYNIIIAATDIHHAEIIIDNTKVIGWDRNQLVKHALNHPIKSLYFFYISFLLFYKFSKLVPFFNTLAKLIFLDNAIVKTQPDLIHFHGTSGALLSAGLWIKNQKKMLRIHGINGSNPSIPFNELHNKIENYITSFDFIKVTFVTNSIIKEWKQDYGNFSCDMVPILNGFNPLLFYPINASKSVKKKYDLITISGISDNKGQFRIIDALIELKKEGINLSYLIIGSGTNVLIDRIKYTSHENKLNVTTIDYLPQVQLVKYLHESKYFILPSITEGFGKVFVESIGAGVPVIIPKHLPLAKESEILNSKNSFLIEDNTKNSIYNGLKQVFQHPVKYSENEISDTVKDLQWSNLAKQYINLYNSVFIS
jgi:glycosyltransferase involved in cell wall biosynthesis